MLTIEHVSKAYHRTLAVNDVSFVIPDSCISVLVGPNGAGKSTLIKSMMGLLKYEGQITLDGVSTQQPEGRRYLSYVPELPTVYALLTVREHIEFSARLYGVRDWEATADQLLHRFDLYDKKDKFGSELSKGMQQKVSICAALITQPKLVLFDEPMMGLDPHAIKELTAVFGELKAAGHACMISTHILNSVEQVWDRAMILQDGMLKAALGRDELTEAYPTLESVFFSVTEGLSPESVAQTAAEGV